MNNTEALTANGLEWQDRAGRDRIDFTRWGIDHGRAFNEVAYAVRQASGCMDWTTLTLSKRNWPMLFAAKGGFYACTTRDAADEYGLRLGTAPDDTILYGHCQGDALMDLVDHDLISVAMPPVREDGQHYLKPDGHPLAGDFPTPADLPTGSVEWDLMSWARFDLTDLGWGVAHELDRRANQRKEKITWNGFFVDCLGAEGRAR